MRILVTGAGGFIGHHLVKALRKAGHFVRGADLKLPEYELTAADEFQRCDLRSFLDCSQVCAGMDWVFQLAADMGGIGFISSNWATIARNNSLININMLDAARAHSVQRYVYSSSACVYNQDLQRSTAVKELEEADAYPALPEKGYGWEKLYAEQLCEYYREEFGLNTKIVRFHNVYGPLGTYDGGREKAPAAACRKVANLPPEGGIVDVWGDGEQTRSFLYIDDCVEGLIRLIEHPTFSGPVNLGSRELVSINELFRLTATIAQKHVALSHDLTKPQGVRGRNSNNDLFRKTFGWEPQTSLFAGLAPTYRWINQRVNGCVA